jgi:1-acyl-sn-glycerol-3-phosphate acyltransferase
VKWLAYRWFKLFGWTFVGDFPENPKLIAVGAPHTTNWDFIAFLAALHFWDFKASFIGKHTLFRWPFGYFFRFFGGIPVDRSKPGGVVRQVAEAFDMADEMILVLAPEGTRRAAPTWKSGFLQIAEAVGVPIVFVSIDYPKREITIGPLVEYKGDLADGRDVAELMDTARAFYSDKAGLRSEGKGPVRLEDETG